MVIKVEMKFWEKLPYFDLFPKETGWKQISDIMFWILNRHWIATYLILKFKHHQICWFWIHLFKIEIWIYLCKKKNLICITGRSTTVNCCIRSILYQVSVSDSFWSNTTRSRRNWLQYAVDIFRIFKSTRKETYQ